MVRSTICKVRIKCRRVCITYTAAMFTGPTFSKFQVGIGLGIQEIVGLRCIGNKLCGMGKIF